MVVGQDVIWYIIVDSYVVVVGSLQLEVFKVKGIEVLLMFDCIDEWMIGFLSEYEGKKFKSVVKGDVLLDEVDKQKQEEVIKVVELLLKKFKELFGECVGEVKVFVCFIDLFLCFVLSDYEMVLYLVCLLCEVGQVMFDFKFMLEINLVYVLFKWVEVEMDEIKVCDLVMLLLEQVEIVVGVQLFDLVVFVQCMNCVLFG